MLDWILIGYFWHQSGQKKEFHIWAMKRKDLCNVTAPFKNILRIIALFFAKMIIYSTWT